MPGDTQINNTNPEGVQLSAMTSTLTDISSENKYLYNGKEFQYPFDFQADILDFLLQGNDTLEQPFTGYDYLKVFREKSTPSNTP